MTDSNVFAIITAHDEKNLAYGAMRLEHNSKWFCQGTDTVAKGPTTSSRESTPDITNRGEDSPDDDQKPASQKDSLTITFDKLMESPLGPLRFGTNEDKCHILLGHPGMVGVSRSQCEITVDCDLAIWLHDCTSKCGTAVGYEGQHGQERRKNETWILAPRPGDNENRMKDITVYAGRVGISIEFPNHSGDNPQYIGNLRQLAEKWTEAGKAENMAVPALAGLDLESIQQTQMPTEKQPPTGLPLYYKQKRLGEGPSGSVWRAIRTRDGAVYAVKSFQSLVGASKLKRKQSDEIPSWLKDLSSEFRVMENIEHVRNL